MGKLGDKNWTTDGTTRHHNWGLYESVSSKNSSQLQAIILLNAKLSVVNVTERTALGTSSLEAYSIKKKASPRPVQSRDLMRKLRRNKMPSTVISATTDIKVPKRMLTVLY